MSSLPGVAADLMISRLKHSYDANLGNPKSTRADGIDGYWPRRISPEGLPKGFSRTKQISDQTPAAARERGAQRDCLQTELFSLAQVATGNDAPSSNRHANYAACLNWNMNV
jgi:hypothetical protein